MKLGAVYKICFYVFLFGLIFENLLSAQTLNLRNYSAEDGLIQSQIQAILQDDEGYLWFATMNGVYKYDGHSFLNYNQDSGLASNFIQCALKDDQGNLWFGHNNGCLTEYNCRSKSFIVHFLTSQQSDASLTVYSLFEDSEHHIWAGTVGKGVFEIQEDTLLNFQKKDGLSSNYILAISEDGKNNIWLGTDHGITLFNIQTGRIDSLTARDGLPVKGVSGLLRDDTGDIWIGTKDKGLYLYKPSDRSVIHLNAVSNLRAKNIWGLYEDSNRDIWFLTENQGAVRYIGGKPPQKKGQFEFYTTRNGLSFNTINCVFEDSEGNYWFGTNGMGVCELRDESFKLYSKVQGLQDNSVWSIYVDNPNHIWVGTNKGISEIEIKSGKIRVKNQLFSKLQGSFLNNVNKIFKDHNGTLWIVVLNKGLYYKKGLQRTWKKFRLPVRYRSYKVSSAEISKQGSIFIGTQYHGLLIYDPNKNKFKQVNRTGGLISSDTIRVINRDRDGDLWIGTENGGLIRYDGSHFKIFNTAFHSATSIAKGKGQDIWVVTYTDQLFLLRNGKAIDYTKGYGLAGQTLYSVVADSHEVWVGISKGVARLKYGLKRFEFFGKQGGFPIAETNENAAFRDRWGHFWFGTIDGLVEFDPAKVRKNIKAPLIHITDLKIFHQSAPFPRDAKFRYNQNYLTFDFIGLSFTVPEKVRYQYKLEGFDRNWSPITDAVYATYSNLPSGTYTFMVKARNNDGIWDKTPAAYSFTIMPPFWKTWWFGIIILFFVGFAIYLLIYYRTRKIDQDRRRLEEKVTERTKELQREKEEVEKAYEALHESETKFRSYTELASSGIYIHQDDRFKYVNKAGRQISGYTNKELMQMNIWNIVHPDFREMMKQRFLDRMQGKKTPARYEFKILTKNKEERWLDFSGKIITYDGKPALLATVFDITDRKKAEEALIAEKERLSVTLRNISEGVISVDTDHNIVLMNRRAKELLECPGDCTERKIDKILKLRDVHTSKPVKPVDELLNLNGNPVEERTALLITHKDQERLVEYSVSLLKNKESETMGAVLVLRDITEKHRLEQEVLKSQKLESVGILAGGIAHDFNNILTAIIGNLSLIKMNISPDEKVLKRIESAEKASARAQELTQQLLTFSKGGTPVKQLTSIRDLISDSVEFILAGSNVKCELNFDPGLPAVDVDAGQISQVVQNLVLNADQAMPEGGTIHIRAYPVAVGNGKKADLDPGSYVCIEVADNGIGISGEYLPKIFDPFFSTKQSGSGLGLATCYSIMKKHNGSIQVKSSLGEGTTFFLYLPASEKSVEKTPVEIPSIYSKGSGSILIMDDEAIIRETATEMLSYLGYTVTTVEDGQQAIDVYKKSLNNQHKFTAIIMDLTIPGGMGGKTAVREILSMDPEATVIVSSGYSTDPIMADYKEYGFRGRLKKPFTINEIARVFTTLRIGME